MSIFSSHVIHPEACTKKTLWKYWLAAPDSGIKSLESQNSTPSLHHKKKKQCSSAKLYEDILKFRDQL